VRLGRACLCVENARARSARVHENPCAVCGLVQVEWEVRASDAARALEERLACVGCTVIADLLTVDFDTVGA
jgi:hypothetical protein